MISISLDGYGWLSKSIFKFPAGEIGVKISQPESLPNSPHATIYASLFSSDDIMELAMVVDALRRMDIRNLSLSCPYLPYVGSGKSRAA